MDKIFGVNIEVVATLAAAIIPVLGLILQFISWVFKTPKDLCEFFREHPVARRVLITLFFTLLGIGFGAWVTRNCSPDYSHWNSTTSISFDFEDPNEIIEWYFGDPNQNGGLERASDSTSAVVSNISFSGESSLELKRELSLNPQQETKFWIVGKLKGKIGNPSLIVGHIYFPDNPSYEIAWSQVCLESDVYGWSECVGYETLTGAWNNFALNPQNIYFIDDETGEVEQIGFGSSKIINLIVQGAIKGDESVLVDYEMYIDEIEIFEGYERKK